LQVTFAPNINITKAQNRVIRSKVNLKDYVYSIMGMLWSREVLCTHSLSGKASNAFKEKDAKPQLDKEKVQSICGKLIFSTLNRVLKCIVVGDY
jgi:hypothetical protein